MSGRILGIELRRSTAWVGALALAVTGIVMLYLIPVQWGGRWLSMAFIQREQLYLLWPLALGAGAWQARREARARIGELLSATSRPRWQRGIPTAVAMATGITAGYLAMFAAGAGQVAGTASYLPAGVAPTLVVGLIALVSAVWLGMAVGHLLPSPFTPPVSVLVAILALMSVPLVLRGPGDTSGDLPVGALLSPVLNAPVTNVFEFYRITERVHLAQGLWLAALAVGALIAYTATRPVARLLAVAPVVLGLAVAMPLLPDHYGQAYVTDRGATEPVCAEGQPSVCVARVHGDLLDHLVGPGRKALAVLSTKVPDAPTAVREVEDSQWTTGPQSATAIHVELLLGADGGPLQDERQLVWTLLEGAGTRPCAPAGGTDAIQRQQAARLAVAAWLLDEAPPANRWAATQARQAWDVLRQFPETEQRRRVGEVRASALTCDGRDLIDLLIGKEPR